MRTNDYRLGKETPQGEVECSFGEEKSKGKVPAGLPLWFRWYRILLPMQEIQETQVQSLGWEDSLEEGMATQYSCLENLMNRGAW